MKSVRRDEVARLYGVSGSLTERLSRTAKPIYALQYMKRRLQLCSYERSQALKILKRIFGYFLGACKKLPAQQSGKKAGNTKRLNGTKEEINPSLALPFEDIRGGNKN